MKKIPAYLAVMVFAYASPLLAVPEPVIVDGGQIRGVDAGSPGVRVFRGIPYAAPPVGPLRWKPPQPVVPWTGVKMCDRFGPSCPQPDSPLGDTPTRQDEDCLSLNVWTAARDAGEKRPVMVWIHGGANVIGSSSQPLYDGRTFAARGVVLLSINYRLGVFGFLAHPELSAESPHRISGNYGILDMIAALQWVQRNIARFGGNPQNVTLFGESAGGVDTGVLLVSPLARGLFQRAILESGTPALVQTPLRGSAASGESSGQQIFRLLGAASLHDARLKPAREFLDSVKAKVGLLSQGMRLGPVIDGRVIPDDPMKLFAEGHFHTVPVLLGSNANEGTLFTRMIPPIGSMAYRFLVRRIFPTETEQVLRLFPANDQADARESLNRLVTIAAFAAPARRMARLVSSHEPAVYLYRFSRVIPALARAGMGATHGSEIPFVFNTMTRGLAVGITDRNLAQQMQTYWIQFATTGDPNGNGLPTWPRYTPADDPYLEFGDTIRVGHHLEKEACDLFDHLGRTPAGQ